MAASQVEVQKWIQRDLEAVQAKREAADVREATVSKEAELAEKKVLIRKWQKARRRDARDKILAALGESGVD